jgi:DNA adenine methylase
MMTQCFLLIPLYQTNGIGPGRRLYRYADIDHEAVFSHLANVRGDFLLCYHDCADIRDLTKVTWLSLSFCFDAKHPSSAPP